MLTVHHLFWVFVANGYSLLAQKLQSSLTTLSYNFRALLLIITNKYILTTGLILFNTPTFS